jgi:hypothetical protein
MPALASGGGKAALARAPSAPLPVEAAQRPKTGFGVPIGAWLNGRGVERDDSRSNSKGLVSRRWSRRVFRVLSARTEIADALDGLLVAPTTASGVVLRNIVIAAARSLWSAGCVGCATGDILGRYVMYKKLGVQFAGRDLGDRILSISHSRKLCALLGAQESAILEANYPEHSLANLRFESKSFSALVSDQVLEHVACPPEQAVAEV